MKTIKPEGAMLIVHPLPKEESETDAGIVVTDFQLIRAEVFEVSDEWESRIPRGSIVLFSDSDGVGKSIHYQKKSCLWISGKAFGEGGDLFGLEITDKK